MGLDHLEMRLWGVVVLVCGTAWALALQAPARSVYEAAEAEAARFVAAHPGLRAEELAEAWRRERSGGASQRPRAGRFDVGELAYRADASIGCECPLSLDECAESVVYENAFMSRGASSSPMKLYYKDSLPLDVMLAGDDNCQEIQGLEVCDGSDSSCVPSAQSLIYDCDAMVETMLGVARVRGQELVDDDVAVTAATAAKSGGAVSGDDDVFYGLSSQTVSRESRQIWNFRRDGPDLQGRRRSMSTRSSSSRDSSRAPTAAICTKRVPSDARASPSTCPPPNLSTSPRRVLVS